MSMNHPIHSGAFSFIRKGISSTLVPYEYTGVDDEILAHKQTAHIRTSLHYGTPIYDVKGPNAAKFMSSICINDFSNVRSDGLRHAVICNEKGQIMTDGVVIRIGENWFRTYWLQPVIQFLLEKSGMEVSGGDKTGSEYIYQIASPKSLEILEKACNCNIHDIKFARHRTAQICGTQMRVIRLGMAGGSCL